MRMKPFVLSFALTAAAILLMGGSAYASELTFNTNADETGFQPGNELSIMNSSGASAMLTFTPEPNSTVGVPTNINYGKFTLVCATCTTQDVGTTQSAFGAFTFNLVVTDETNNATGVFVGTSEGGDVWSDVSTITVNWDPIMLGPGETNAATGNFGLASFNITQISRIVAPNSGDNPGQTTVQGDVDAAIPEPATLSMVGGFLLVLGLLRRKVTARS